MSHWKLILKIVLALVLVSVFYLNNVFTVTATDTITITFYFSNFQFTIPQRNVGAGSEATRRKDVANRKETNRDPSRG